MGCNFCKEDSPTVCSEFITEISEVIREKVAVMLCSSTAFSILTDGSQPRKTGSEKEIILVRFEREGIPIPIPIPIPMYYVIGADPRRKCLTPFTYFHAQMKHFTTRMENLKGDTDT